MEDLELIRLAEIRDERDDRVEALEGAVGALQSWRTEVDGHIDDVRYDLRRFSKLSTSTPQHPPLRARPELAAAELHPGGFPVDWPSGHRVASTTRVPDYGSVTTIVPSPANGKPPSPNPVVSHVHFPHHPSRPPNPGHPQHNTTQPYRSHPPSLGHLPKMHFPKFDGEDPQYWMTCAQNYFDLYAVDPSMWVKCSTMQFIGAARRWLQSVERQPVGLDWPSFYRLIRERFCRDQHELLIRQLFHIKQTTTVQDYVDRFVNLIEQLCPHNQS
jgi:hypothetical protein